MGDEDRRGDTISVNISGSVSGQVAVGKGSPGANSGSPRTGWTEQPGSGAAASDTGGVQRGAGHVAGGLR